MKIHTIPALGPGRNDNLGDDMDWSSILQEAVKGTAAIATAQITKPSTTVTSTPFGTTATSNSPLFAQSAGSSMSSTTMLIIGGLAIGAFLFLKRK